MTTANIPLLINLLGLAFKGESPFKASVYFVNMVDLLDQKWGTSEPVALRDKDLGMVRLRAFGTYSIRVADAQRFVAQIVGQRGYYSTSEITNWLRSQIIAGFTDLLGETKAGLFDLPALIDELGVALKSKISDSFEQSGITVKQLFVQSISATEDTLKAIDERAAMGAIGDMNSYLRFKAAHALGDAAAGVGQGGSGGEGVARGLVSALASAWAPALAAWLPRPCRALCNPNSQPQPQPRIQPPRPKYRPCSTISICAWPAARSRKRLITRSSPSGRNACKRWTDGHSACHASGFPPQSELRPGAFAPSLSKKWDGAECSRSCCPNGSHRLSYFLTVQGVGV